ncbi:MAG TPA: hypothetical protein DGU45_03680 [Planctomycetes bacterium]|nr:hypothetical protein [Planctomycetota bacterium]
MNLDHSTGLAPQDTKRQDDHLKGSLMKPDTHICGNKRTQDSMSRVPQGSQFLLLILIFPLLLCSCSGGPSRNSAAQNGPDPIADARWQNARKAWLLDDVAVAQSAFSLFAEKYPTDQRSGEALLSAGICAQRRGRLEEAEGLFREAQTRGGAIAARALIQRGSISLELQPSRAATCFKEAARMATNAETQSEALYKRGIALQRIGQFELATAAFEKCIAVNGSRGHSAQAQLRLQYDPWFSVQVGAFLQRSHAMKQLRRLQDGGFPAELRMPGRKGSPLHRVLSGRFTDRKKAQQHSTRIQSALGIDEVQVIP